MRRSDTFMAALAGCIVLLFGLACNSLRPTTSGPSNTTASNTTATNTASDSTTTMPANVEPADFTVNAEELDKEFTRKGVKEEDLEKYKNKNIAVTGRVSMLVMEKKGTVQPWVTLYAPGILHGVSCYFDDEDVDQMKQLKDDKMAKVQGFQDDFIIPELSPKLKHCVVLEGSK